MHPNAQLIEGFYTAFAANDAETMAAAYASDATFSDPVFTSLKGELAPGMWRMLVAQASDLKVTWSDVVADDNGGSARWEATYSFSKTGRQVHNVISAKFQFKEGLIISHVDTFDLWKWTRMALGIPGVLLGWTPLVQNKIRGQAKGQLDRFMEKQRA